MSKTSQYRKILVSTPAVIGVLLLLLAVIDLQQFRDGTTDVHSMLARELPLVLLGFVSSIVAAATGLSFLIQKQWRMVAWATASILGFMACFVLGGEFGAAYLNAT